MAPENTLASLEAALAAGVRAVEFDLHVASCGTPVLFHDVNLGRNTLPQRGEAARSGPP